VHLSRACQPSEHSIPQHRYSPVCSTAQFFDGTKQTHTIWSPTSVQQCRMGNPAHATVCTAGASDTAVACRKVSHVGTRASRHQCSQPTGCTMTVQHPADSPWAGLQKVSLSSCPDVQDAPLSLTTTVCILKPNYASVGGRVREEGVSSP
jgi:hypothetical protein